MHASDILCAAIETFGLVLCIELAPSHHWWALLAGWFAIGFSYLDGKYGWSEPK